MHRGSQGVVVVVLSWEILLHVGVRMSLFPIWPWTTQYLCPRQDKNTSESLKRQKRYLFINSSKMPSQDRVRIKIAPLTAVKYLLEAAVEERVSFCNPLLSQRTELWQPSCEAVCRRRKWVVMFKKVLLFHLGVLHSTSRCSELKVRTHQIPEIEQYQSGVGYIPLNEWMNEWWVYVCDWKSNWDYQSSEASESSGCGTHVHELINMSQEY